MITTIKELTMANLAKELKAGDFITVSTKHSRDNCKVITVEPKRILCRVVETGEFQFINDFGLQFIDRIDR